MPERLPPLDWLRSFEAAARHGSFTAAADELGLTQAGISQQIRKLEGWLGAALFQRRPRGVALSEEGAAYLPHVQAALQSLARSTRELFRGGAGVETVRIASPVSFAALWLAPRLPGLAAALPNVRIALSAIHLPAEYERHEADLEIRFGAGEWPGLTAHRLAHESLVPVCAPDLAATAAPWTGLPRLEVVGPREMWSAWFAGAGMAPPLTAPHRFDTFVAAYEAARAGTGVLLGSRPLIDAALDRGELVALSPFALATDRGHFLTLPAGAPRRAAVDDVIARLMRE